jgi:hypothetical protein
LALDSLSRFAERRPSTLALAHYGLLPGDAVEALEDAGDVLREWASVAEAAWRSGRDVEDALRERFGAELDAIEPDQRRRMETLNGLHSNAEGLKLWLAGTGGASPGHKPA